MSVLKLWERYFILDILKVFLLFLGLFYALYTLIDYTSHTSDFARLGYGIKEVAFYYLCHFVMRLEILIPFSLLLATMRTICQLNLNNELVAMMASGIKLKRISWPFILVALVCSALLYANFQFFLPTSNTALRRMKDAHQQEKNAKKGEPDVGSIVMEDNSLLLFQTYDTARDRFFDVFWVKSADEIYHMLYLYPGQLSSQGRLVDKFERQENHALKLVDSYAAKTFESLGMEEDVKEYATADPDTQSISRLWHRLPKHDRDMTDDEARMVSRFHYMLAIPLVCLLVVIGPMPFCVHFTRQFNVFYRYGIAIVLFLGFFTFLNATRVLGENQVIPPELGIWIPFALVFPPLLFFYLRMR